MLATKCCGCRRIVPEHRNKAKWVGNRKRIIRQYAVSLKSYFVYPFSVRYENATKEFFQTIYNCTKVDDLIFDGNEELYLEKANCLFTNIEKYDVIYDCGCGKGSFLKFATTIGLLFDRYIGIDFAIDAPRNYANISFEKTDILTYRFQYDDKSRLVALCNVACYLSDDALNNLFCILSKGNTTILIIDPVPGLFWDATFNHVKLYYRSIKKMNKIMRRADFGCVDYSVDYLIQLGTFYGIPLSYACLYEKINK